MAQDYMHSQVLAQIYARIPQADRVRMGTPAPEDIARAWGKGSSPLSRNTRFP